MAAKVQRIDDLDSISVAGVNWRPLRRTLGVTAFGTNAYTANAGEEIVEKHDELLEDPPEGQRGHEEMYVVITGRATFTVAGEEIDAPAGTVVFLPDPADNRHAIAAEDGTTVLAVGGFPGTLKPSPWEYWFAAEPAHKSGDHTRAYEIASAGLADHPDHPVLHYQLACYAARDGDREKAIEHLRAALATGSKHISKWLSTDEDLESVRAEFA